MSDTSFAFEAAEPGFEDEKEAGSRRNLVLAGGLAVVLAAGGFFLLTGGGEEEDFSFVPPARAAAAPVVPAAEVVLPVESQIQLGRNPFKPLYIEPEAAPAVDPAPVQPAPAPVQTAPQVIFVPIGGDSPTFAPAPTQTFTPTQPAPAQPAPAQPAPAKPSPAKPSPTATTPPPATEYALTFTRVYGDGTQATGVFDVDGQQMIAKVGSVFGPTAQIKLLGLGHKPDGTWYATLQVGDSDAFEVLTGETVYIK